jgi:hypothetical protein
VRCGRSRNRDAGSRPVSQNSTAIYVEVDIVLGDPVSRTKRPKPRHRRAGSLRSKSSGFPRKEVIQPQLPLRLPCYDFTPITNPTFDGSLPCGLGHRLRVLPAFVV